MATAVNPRLLPGIDIGTALGEIAEHLRKITVRIGDGAGFGSGVLWRPDGLVITNAHVARSRIQQVELADGRRLEGVLMKRDERADLAALATGVRSRVFAAAKDSRVQRAGEVVIAVGNPMGEMGAMTAGVIHCSTGRGSWVVTDLRLAPGYSGGPLVDVWGQVVGVNSMIVGGLGYAVPTHVIEEFLAGMRTEAA